jgi:dTDP-4-amino-4,6-dideoxygalactose transaminase
VRASFLPFSPPAIGPEEIAEVVDTLRSEWITTGPKTRRFESAFAEYLGAAGALAVSSATDAMLVGLAALGVGPGDEVITTVMTFCSTVHVIEHLGAKPVLVDVDPDTLCIDPRAVERAVTPRTKGILPVHIFGHPCDLDPLLDLATSRRLFVLEDAAHSLPARYKRRMIGTIGTATAFSFYATKNMTTAEGGMLTGHPDLIELARIWSLHGMSRDAYNRYSATGSWFYDVVLPGFKCNMTDIQASLGLQQLKKLSWFQEQRLRIVRRYQSALGGCAALQVPVERPDVESAWHIFPLRLNLEALTIDRQRFIQEMSARNIGTSVHFIPIHLHRYYREKYGYAPDDFPVAHSRFQQLVSMPLHPRLSDADVDDVVDAVLDIVKTYGR